ncbi:MAG TPA: ABC transporter permease [Bryobacteraceae bacterium]|nr:ABC transporter permease [Bryobacteraceae bacterium]
MREDDLDRELRAHLDLEAEELGDPQAARRVFGNLTAVREAIHEMSRWTIVEQLLQDLRYGTRLLLRSPGFSIVAMLTLALGIGANTAIFSVVRAVLLRPLPFPEPERLVALFESSPNGNPRNVVNPLNFMNWRERSHSFEGMAALHGWTSNITGEGGPLAVDGMRVSTEFFSVLGVSPFMGRGFIPEEGVPGREYSTILSYSFWQTHYGGDRHILGRKIVVNGDPTSVIGILPRDFHFPRWRADLYVPMPLDRGDKHQEGRYLATVARLKAGVSLAQAQQELTAVASQLATERPAMDKGWGATVVPLLDDVTAKVRLPLLVLLAAVGLVLFIACANVANLLLMRGAGRLREIALRTALGAGRRRILQQLLSESLLLAGAGWIAGVALGYWGLHALLALIPASVPLPRMESIRLDGGVFLFALGISFATAILFGLAPAIQISRPRLQSALQQGSQRTGVGGSRIVRQALVIAEIALALLLLAGAGLLMRSFDRLISVNPGFRPEHMLTMEMFTSPAKYHEDRKRSQYVDNVLAQIRQVPGVEGAGSTHFLPLTGMNSGSCFLPAPGPEPDTSSPDADFLIVSPGYFETMGMAMLNGRNFGEQDHFGSPSVTIVNRAFAQRFFKGQDPIGKKLNVCWTVPNPVEVVGVVADARQTELQEAPQPTIFLENSQGPMYFARLVIRTRDDPRKLSRAVQAAIHRVDPDQAISDVQTMEEIFADSVARPRFQMVLLLVFAGMAVLLATIGVYGVVSYSVSQRTQEIGIRVALGASASDVAHLVLREGLVLGCLGVAAGLAGAIAFTRVLRSLLFEVTPTDQATLATVAGLLLAVAAAATLVPARRAASVDPTVALRHE